MKVVATLNIRRFFDTNCVEFIYKSDTQHHTALINDEILWKHKESAVEHAFQYTWDSEIDGPYLRKIIEFANIYAGSSKYSMYFSLLENGYVEAVEYIHGGAVQSKPTIEYFVENNKQPSPSSLATQLPGNGLMAFHPVETGAPMHLFSIIMNLNDKHRWTREQIADWLETLDLDLRFNVETA